MEKELYFSNQRLLKLKNCKIDHIKLHNGLRYSLWVLLPLSLIFGICGRFYGIGYAYFGQFLYVVCFIIAIIMINIKKNYNKKEDTNLINK